MESYPTHDILMEIAHFAPLEPIKIIFTSAHEKHVFMPTSTLLGQAEPIFTHKHGEDTLTEYWKNNTTKDNADET